VLKLLSLKETIDGDDADIVNAELCVRLFYMYFIV